MGGEMTYQELMQLIQQQGGGMPQQQPGQYGTGDSFDYMAYQRGQQGREVQLPDGRTASVDANGNITTSRINDARNSQDIMRMGPDGRPVNETQAYDPNSNFQRSLAGLAGMAAMPVLGGLAAGYAGAPAAVAPAAGGGAVTGVGAGGAGAGGLTAAQLAAIEGSEVAAEAGNAALAAGAGGGGLLGSVGSTLGSVGSALAGNPALVGAGLGALAGAAGSGDATSTTGSTLAQNQTSTNTSGLAPWLQPHAQSYVQRQAELSQQPFQEYGGQGVAPLNADQRMGIDQVRHLAANGDPLVGRARDQQSALLSGQMLGANPYLDRVAQGIGDRMGEAYATGTRGALTGGTVTAGGSPRYSSAYQQTVGNADRAFGDSLGQTMSGLYYGNYRDERNAQDSAARNSLGFSADQRANTAGLIDAGGLQQRTDQAGLDYQRREFDRRLAYPQQQLDALGRAINPAFGQQTTGSQQSNSAGTGTQTLPGVSPLQGALGGALSGWGAGMMFGQQPQQQQPQQPQPQGQSAPFPQYFGGGFGSGSGFGGFSQPRPQSQVAAPINPTFGSQSGLWPGSWGG
jgi:hypothetical protein